VSCDLLDERQLAELPDAPHVIFMTGRKFGSTGDEAGTWAMNSFLPGTICRRYRQSNMVAFSTGNVYGLTSVAGGGSRETDELRPVGEYAMSCLGRERVFEYFSRAGNIPTAILRLNYACELRYGVLVDLARQVWREEPVDLPMGHFNILWQGDANAWALSALAHTQTPPWVVNLAGPELLSVREVCEHLGRRMNKPVRLTGQESGEALLSNASQALARWGRPRVSAGQLVDWVADWTMRGGRTLEKPTHFASRDGRF
jgi:nucleoside-diphosphate-sugar epimerase